MKKRSDIIIDRYATDASWQKRQADYFRRERNHKIARGVIYFVAMIGLIWLLVALGVVR